MQFTAVFLRVAMMLITIACKPAQIDRNPARLNMFELAELRVAITPATLPRKRWASSWSWMSDLVPETSSLTVEKPPRRISCCMMIPNQRSIAVIRSKGNHGLPFSRPLERPLILETSLSAMDLDFSGVSTQRSQIRSLKRSTNSQ